MRVKKAKRKKPDPLFLHEARIMCKLMNKIIDTTEVYRGHATWADDANNILKERWPHIITHAIIYDKTDFKFILKDFTQKINEISRACKYLK